MSCERYWCEGIALVERGEPDPHRDTCIACRREHEVREELVRALALVGDASGVDPAWEARIWRRISQLEVPRRTRWWRIATALASALAIVLVVCEHRTPQRTGRTRIEVLPGEGVETRSTAPRVGDRIRVVANPTDEVRVYRADRLVLRCPVSLVGPGCLSDDLGTVAEAIITDAVDYRIVVVTSPAPEPAGRLDLDLWAVVQAGGDYQIADLSVR